MPGPRVAKAQPWAEVSQRFQRYWSRFQRYRFRLQRYYFRFQCLVLSCGFVIAVAEIPSGVRCRVRSCRRESCLPRAVVAR